uniref:Essential protein Yae1 N-terminal domain-containing protein n=1 Tax=Laticauda laticaudata TaxID=8630 RepID=A0A8C5SXD9_LATLA
MYVLIRPSLHCLQAPGITFLGFPSPTSDLAIFLTFFFSKYFRRICSFKLFLKLFTEASWISTTNKMSWLQSAISQCYEDVFDEDADEMDIAQKEWKSAMEKRIKEGYREGVEAGKVVTLQQGFNQGYKEAVRVMFECSQLKGIIRYVVKIKIPSSQRPTFIMGFIKCITVIFFIA